MADVIDHANIHFEPSWRPKVGGQKPINAQNWDCFLFNLGPGRKMIERLSTTFFEGFWMVNSVGYVKNRSDLFKNPSMDLLFLNTYPIINIIFQPHSTLLFIGQSLLCNMIMCIPPSGLQQSTSAVFSSVKPRQWYLTLMLSFLTVSDLPGQLFTW